MTSQSSALALLVNETENLTLGDDAAEPFFDLMRLPPELRDEIWAFALPTDRVLLASVELRVLRPLPAPPIAWVCRESRAVAQRHGSYYSIGCNGTPSIPRWTWFSPNYDRVLLNFLKNTNDKRLRSRRGDFALDVRHVIVMDTYTFDHQYHKFVSFPLRDQMDPKWLHPADLALYPNIQSIGVLLAGVVIEQGSDWNHWNPIKNFSATGVARQIRPHEPETTDPKLPAVCSCSEAPEEHSGKRGKIYGLPSHLARAYSSKSLWRMLRSWFEVHHVLLTPNTASFNDSMKSAWAAQIKRWAPHVYPAEMTGYGNRHLKATPGPRCMHAKGAAYDGVKGEELYNRLYNDPGDIDVDDQLPSDWRGSTGPWALGL
ncbi:hypothetical protein PG996_006559 [Apiospora saccharicola]|uniref:2EXR domain-containing protein n=1 Tax=Apiospora saccharicola TaxID=335842 RepID=A0ABR1V977_9PEZI